MSHRKYLYTFPNPFFERGWGNTIKSRLELEGFSGPETLPAHLQANVDAAKVEYIALMPKTNTFPLTQSNLEEFTLAVFKSPSYGIVLIDRHVVLFQRGANRREGWRLLAKAASVPVANEKQMEAAFWKWLTQ